MIKLRTLTAYPGVYQRLSSRRRLPDGQNPDVCYEIFYTDSDGNLRYEKIGWVSEGITLEQAAEIRAIRKAEQKQLRLVKKQAQKKRPPHQAKRLKTKFTGVYARESFSRFCPDGKPDKCYDIVWYTGKGTYHREIVGWRSEGYTEADAVRIRSERIKAYRHPEFFSFEGITLDECWKIYCSRWLPNLKESHNFIARYQRHIQPQFGCWKLTDIKTYHVEDFKQSLFSKKLSPARVKLILCDLRRIMRKMVEWEKYSGPLPKFHMPKVENERLRYFSVQETKDFLMELSLYSCEMYYIAKIGFYTGLRLTDILSLTKNDVDINKDIIYTDGKSGRRETYIPKGIKEDLLYLLKNTNSYLFTNKNGKKYTSKYMSNKFSRYIAHTNINKGVTDRKYKYVFHCGRHSFGSLLAEQGVSLYIIQHLMGHEDEHSTRRYAKVSPNAKREAITKLDDYINIGRDDKKEKA